MCRWGCGSVDTTFMCKWCGTRFCNQCFKGDFHGLMKEESWCRVCNQKRCQGKRVEYVIRPQTTEKDSKKKGAPGTAKSRSKSAKRSVKSAKRSGSRKSKKRK